MAHLDYREKGGYSLLELQFYQADGSSRLALVYTGTEDNEEFVGEEPLAQIAKTIAESRGPSGPNIDYLMNLVIAMRDIAPDHPDEHLLALETQVRALQEAATPATAAAPVEVIEVEPTDTRTQ
ncbi:uncharacterized protein MONBRDRAFT_11658 [Monosiga brevicollis MX1]|uniref:glutathione-specific gamma-glutamylcyclotransferase n=1 Tax=Monosiga brevicollis TaxID=81824 RepID=A9V9X1_MONBE|nr:uncharacterized protein MONBRDRAFT_11658 [Monosiga brevicollis MX1]EDQ85631.1 predicted protein [Monosiga brevicollis MX1]|eukprot:XP_001749580.1 hypothetical protein [Monosiga brevicollis MX1]